MTNTQVAKEMKRRGHISITRHDVTGIWEAADAGKLEISRRYYREAEITQILELRRAK